MNALRLVVSLALLLCIPSLSAAEDVIEAWRGGDFVGPVTVSINPTDSSCWVADYNGNGVVHLGADGMELWRTGAWRSSSFTWPVSANRADGSCWVTNDDKLVHLGADGAEIPLASEYYPGGLSVDPTDGSCWAHRGGTVDHITLDGTPRSSTLGFCNRIHAWQMISVNPSDGSCWAGAGDPHAMMHIAADGTVVWQSGINVLSVPSVSANERDNSCWAGMLINRTPDAYYIVHLAEDGTELWRGLPSVDDVPWSVSVNNADGSCWVARGQEVIHLDYLGAELWRGSFVNALSVSANTADGSCWVADKGAMDVIHLTIPGWKPSIFYDVPWYFWAYDEIAACSEAGIVNGYDDELYHPSNPITRDQMAVYIARALVSPSGDAAIPDPPTMPSFTDVPTTHWAYKHIEYAVSQNVVQGYTDGGYHPSATLDRGQMAVFVARAMVAPGGDAAIPEPVTPPSFTDISSGYWAFKHVEYCAGNGVVNGFEDGLYHPEQTVTRDQMAVYVARAFDLMP